MSAHLEFFSIEAAAAALPAEVPVHLAIGVFDAVHRGHQLVVGAAIRNARDHNGLAAALTFYPHPSRLLRPDKASHLIMSHARRVRRLFKLGLDVVITQPFDETFAELEAEDFVPLLKRSLPTLAHLYVGDNWLFGKNRRGTTEFLDAECKRHGVRLMILHHLNDSELPISSTRIREALTDGRIEDANKMLGYSYYAEGVVQRGKQLGRTLGFPTLNLPWLPERRPRFGVYAVHIFSEKHPTPLPAIANYGIRPTVEDTEKPMLEINLLGECPFDAGAFVIVEWEHFIRPEKKFPTLDALREQIAVDKAAAGEWFANNIAQM